MDIYIPHLHTKSGSNRLKIKEIIAKILTCIRVLVNWVKVRYSILQIIDKLGRFMTFFFFALLEWLPTLTNSKYIDLIR